jgi:endothelin-converting enzyme
LLSDAGEDAQATNPTSPSLTERISSVAQEPLTPLSQILLILVLVLLLTTSVCGINRLWNSFPTLNYNQIFVGLFAGSQHRLQLEREVRQNHTLTATATTTSTAISSAISSATTTKVTTTTVIVPPIPPPTTVPEVRSMNFGYVI